MSQPESQTESNQDSEVELGAVDEFGLPFPDTLTQAEADWLTNATIGPIPDPEPQGQMMVMMETEEVVQAEQVDSLELQEEQYDQNIRYIGIINDLRSKLDDSESQRQDYWEALQHQETKVADLETQLKRLRDNKEPEMAGLREANKALAEKVKKLSEEKEAAVKKMAKNQHEAIGMAQRVGKQLATVTNKAEAERQKLRAPKCCDKTPLAACLPTVKPKSVK